jgi:hypothetical protein
MASLVALLPLVPPSLLLAKLIGNPLHVVHRWMTHDKIGGSIANSVDDDPPPVSSQLLAYVIVALLGYAVTNRLVPNIKQYTLRKGISGKDLGKKGTPGEDKDV